MEYKITEKKFKQCSKDLKRNLKDMGFDISLGAAQNLLARTFGSKDYNTILPELRKVESESKIENNTSDKNKSNFKNEKKIYLSIEDLNILKKCIKCESKEFLLSAEDANKQLNLLLTPNQFQVFYHRYILEKKLKPIAELLNLSISRIRQIQYDAYKKLIHPKTKNILFNK